MPKPEIFECLKAEMVDKTDEILQNLVGFGRELLKISDDKEGVFSGFLCMAYVAGRLKERKVSAMREVLSDDDSGNNGPAEGAA